MMVVKHAIDRLINMEIINNAFENNELE